MQNKLIIHTVLFLLLIVSSNYAFANTHIPETGQPIPIKVGLYIDDIIHINATSEIMRFQGQLSIQWQDKRLAFQPVQEGTHTKVYADEAALAKLNKIWRPQIVFRDNRGKPFYGARYLSIKSDGTVTYMTRFLREIESRMDFRKFPFDRQKTNIVLQPLTYNADQVKLITWKERSGFARHAHLEEWQVSLVNSSVLSIKDAITHQPISSYVLHIHYHRRAFYFVLQLILPLVLIVLFSFSAFWMLHNPLVNRVAISLTALLTIVVFQWRIYGDLPKVPYSTLTEVALLFSFIVCGFTIIVSVILEVIKDKERQGRYVKAARWFFPLFYLLGIAGIFLFYLLT